jgi:hypothetical protein
MSRYLLLFRVPDGPRPRRRRKGFLSQCGVRHAAPNRSRPEPLRHPATFDHSRKLRLIKAHRPMWRFLPGGNSVSLRGNNAAFEGLRMITRPSLFA